MPLPFKPFIGIVTLCLVFSDAIRAEAPAWAYAVNPPGAAAAVDDGSLKHVPNSTAAFTQKQITAIAQQPPDWHPEEHPAMPGIVGHSREPKVYACAYCHLPNGAGRPENTGLAGLSAGYFKAQIRAFQSGNRPGSEGKRAPQTNMIALASALTDEEIEQAATYFSALKPVSYLKVIEAATVPRTVVVSWMLTRAPGTETEPIGDRIIEITEEFDRFEHRDSRTPYLAYVPVGSIARGAALAATGEGRTVQCATCHGPELKGLADVPRLVGRSPSYLFRQLYDLRNGTRRGGTAELMKPVVEKLTDRDMVDLAAYLASREP